jgi:hypothetical protein
MDEDLGIAAIGSFWVGKFTLILACIWGIEV